MRRLVEVKGMITKVNEGARWWEEEEELEDDSYLPEEVQKIVSRVESEFSPRPHFLTTYKGTITKSLPIEIVGITSSASYKYKKAIQENTRKALLVIERVLKDKYPQYIIYIEKNRLIITR